MLNPKLFQFGIFAKLLVAVSLQDWTSIFCAQLRAFAMDWTVSSVNWKRADMNFFVPDYVLLATMRCAVVGQQERRTAGLTVTFNCEQWVRLHDCGQFRDGRRIG